MLSYEQHYISMDLKQKNKLLYSRAGFGIPMEQYEHPREVRNVLSELFPASDPEPIILVTDEEWAQHSPKAMKMIGDKAEKKEMQKAFREKTKDMNMLWMQEMVSTQYPLREKTALFWHGHFATHIDNPYYDQKLLQILRQNALGNFRDLLFAVSKRAAMLQYLNNQQNKKMHPNENFAREVMELFTLGRGHYTENDIKEAARCFTGWAYDGNGDFIFRTRQHDHGEKTVLGNTGFYDGDDVLNILLRQKQTAVFITQKIYRFFVSDEKIDEKRVKELATQFYDSKYDIGGLLKTIFSSDWFYKENNVGAKVKSPTELLVGYQRMLPMNFPNGKAVIQLQRALGQYLFNAPNVAGWPGGRNWIDSSTLVIRMRLPETILGSKDLDLTAKEVDPETPVMHEENMNRQDDRPVSRFKADVDWTAYINYWKKYNKEDMPEAIAGYLMNTPPGRARLQEVLTYTDHDSVEEYIKSLTILLMELPEYQLT